MNKEFKAFIQEGRITSLFGTNIPPKKKRVDTNYITIVFLINGVIPSKKNRQRARSNFWAIKSWLNKIKTPVMGYDISKQIEDRLKLYIQGSSEHKIWFDNTKKVILEQAAYWSSKYEKYKVIYPLTDVSMKVYHYWADNRKRDLSNKFETIADLLVNAGIIADDSWQVMDSISSDGAEYSGQILDHITLVSVTIRLTK